MRSINNWKELAEVEDSETHKLEIYEINGWIINKETKELCAYLSTRAFCGSQFEHSTQTLQEYGFNVQIKNWDA